MATLATGCEKVRVVTSDDHDLVTGIWSDGRIGSIGGNRVANNKFGELLHREEDSHFVDLYAGGRPYHASLLEQILAMFNTGRPPIDQEETLQILCYIEKANQNRESGNAVRL